MIIKMKTLLIHKIIIGHFLAALFRNLGAPINVNVREGKTSSVGKYLEDRWGREQFEPLLRLSSSDTKVAHDAPLLWIVATRAAAEPRALQGW